MMTHQLAWGYFLVESLGFVLLLAVCFFLLGLLLGWSLWGRLKVALDDARDARETLRDDLKHLRRTQPEIRELRAERQQWAEKNSELRARVEALESGEENQALQRLVKDQTKAMADLQRQLDAAADSENSDAAERAANLKKLKEDLREAKKARTVSDLRLKERENELKALHRRLKEADDNDPKQLSLFDQREADEDFRRQLDATQRKLTDAEKQLAEKTRELNRLQADQPDKNELHALRTEITNLKSELNRKQGEIQSLQDTGIRAEEFQAVKDELAESRRESDRRGNDLERMKEDATKAARNLEAVRSRLADAERKISDREQQIARMEDELKTDSFDPKELQALRDKASDAETQLTELQVLRRKAEEADHLLDEKEARIRNLVRELKDREGDSSELRDLEIQMKELEDQLEQKNEMLANLESQVVELTESEPEFEEPGLLFDKELMEIDENLGALYTTQIANPDNLQRIKGIGKVIEDKLHGFGVYTFDQIAAWNQKNIDAFSERLDFKGRIEREQWIEQAQRLMGK